MSSSKVSDDMIKKLIDSVTQLSARFEVVEGRLQASEGQFVELRSATQQAVDALASQIQQSKDGNRPHGNRRTPPGFGEGRYRHNGGNGDEEQALEQVWSPKLRIDPPKFLGTDPQAWVFKVQEYFNFFKTPPDQRLELVGVLMEGEAGDWFRYKKKNYLLTTWPAFLDEVKAEFEKLLNKIDHVPDAQLIPVFASGLKPPLNRELELRRPATLTAAFALARELDATLTETLSALASYPRRSGFSLAKSIGQTTMKEYENTLSKSL